MRKTANLFLLVLLLAVVACHAAEDRVLYQKKSQYNHIIVQEGADGIRRLLFEENGATQSALDTRDPDRLVVSYTRAIMVALAVVPQPKRILIVGLGGGSMPMFIRRHYPDAQIDVAELDPDVADVAKRFFNFREDARMKAHVGDGRKFIENSHDKYDIIFLDAYGADSIPYALATREFLQAVRAHLTDQGIAVGNVWSEYSNKLYYSMVRTYRDVFDGLCIVRAPTSENRIFIAPRTKQNLSRNELVQKAGRFEAAHRIGYSLTGIVDSGYDPDRGSPADAKILLDADAPKD